MKKDLNQIAKIEKAVKDKYGHEAIQNPRQFWSAEKEEKYLEDLREFYSPSTRPRVKNQETKEGFIIRDNKLAAPRISNHCPVCARVSFKASDDLYMKKFDCCELCYVKYVTGREERWKNGWRPKS